MVHATIKYFWDRVADSGLLDGTNLIIVGDLNFTTNIGEIWGSSASMDPLTNYFTMLLQNHNLVDLPPAAIVPTWRNGRTGLDVISKRLDRFLLSADLAL
jgi:hypothetical protein